MPLSLMYYKSTFVLDSCMVKLNVINGTKLYMCPNYSKEKKRNKKEYVFTNCNLLCNTIIPNMQLMRLI